MSDSKPTRETIVTSSHQNAATVLDVLDAIWNRGDPGLRPVPHPRFVGGERLQPGLGAALV
jgi:hypothetical protein